MRTDEHRRISNTNSVKWWSRGFHSLPRQTVDGHLYWKSLHQLWYRSTSASDNIASEIQTANNEFQRMVFQTDAPSVLEAIQHQGTTTDGLNGVCGVTGERLYLCKPDSSIPRDGREHGSSPSTQLSLLAQRKLLGITVATPRQTASAGGLNEVRGRCILNHRWVDRAH